jgi:glycosyltransferase involved in cell wall biosynthesis
MAINKKILIHHHATVYTDPQTGLRYTYSFIGRWINELSIHFEKVGILFHESTVKSKRHDTLLVGDNIILETLGSPGKAYDRFQKMARVKAACKKASYAYDVLLIRGMTPRQFTVFKHVNVPVKMYLMVGSLIESKPKFKFDLTGLYLYIMFIIRKLEFGKIASEAIMLANSPKVNEEILSLFGVKSKFIPTNTIKQDELRPWKNKVVGEEVSLFFCGRMVADKGIFELLEALYLLNKQIDSYSLTFTGDLSADLKSNFEKLPFWNHIKDRVRFTGFVSFGKELLDLYDSHDIYVLPSYHEGFPHSIWESAAVSTPVITTSVGGIPGILNDSHVWFIPVKSPEAIANAVLEVQNNIEARELKTKNILELLKENTVEAAALKLEHTVSENLNR